MKTRVRLVTARPNFYKINDNPNISLGVVDCSFYTRSIALKDDYHKKQMEMLPYTPVEFIYLETLAKFLSFPLDKTRSPKKTFSTMLQFVKLLIQLIQTLHSLDSRPKNFSGLSTLISDEIEYSEVLNQL